MVSPARRGRVNPRARTHDDRAGDPLDGLVNLFDLGIVLSVAFLLAALSSLDLESAVFSANKAKVPEDTVVAEEGETVRSIDLQPGARVVGRGEQVGTVYRLTDGRTVIVQGEDGAPTGGSTTPDDATGSDDPATGGSTGDTTGGSNGDPSDGSTGDGTGGSTGEPLDGGKVDDSSTGGASPPDEPTLGGSSPAPDSENVP